MEKKKDSYKEIGKLQYEISEKQRDLIRAKDNYRTELVDKSVQEILSILRQ